MDYVNIGKFLGAFGLNGELLLRHNLGKKTALKGLDALFVEERQGSFLPYFLQAVRIKSESEIYVTLEGISVREKALKLAQKQVWLPEDAFKKFAAKSAPINFLGYEIVENGRVLGKILEVIEQPHQVLCRIQYNGKEAYIPLHEETLVKVDKKKSQVMVELPEGLLDVYS